MPAHTAIATAATTATATASSLLSLVAVLMVALQAHVFPESVLVHTDTATSGAQELLEVLIVHIRRSPNYIGQ